MIILEGCDCVGKTTVAKTMFYEMRGWNYVHHTKPPIHPYDYFMMFLRGATPHYIVDRLHWSDVAYSNVYRLGSPLTEHQWRYIELACLSRLAWVIVMTDDYENIAERWGKVNAEMFDLEGQKALLEQYAELVGDSRSFLPRKTYRLPDLVFDGKATPLLQTIIRSEAERANYLKGFPLPAAGLGYTLPGGFLIVGEALSPDIFTDYEHPRFPWDQGSSSEVLWQALNEGGIRWNCGYYTNVRAFNSYDQFALFVNALKPAIVMALGKQSGEAIEYAWTHRKHDFSYDIMAHPAYVKRFKNEDLAVWREELAARLQNYRQGHMLPEVFHKEQDVVY